MNGSEAEQVRQKLLGLRAELLALDGSLNEDATAGEPDQAGMDSISRRDALQAQIIAGEGARQRRRQLQKIEGALRRLEAGEYGRCFICEEEIDALSLSADPTTTRCMNCIDSTSS